MKLVTEINNNICTFCEFEVLQESTNVVLKQKGSKSSIILSKDEFEDYKKVSDFILLNIKETNLISVLFSKFLENVDVNENYDAETLHIEDSFFEDDNFINNGKEIVLDISRLSFAQNNINYSKLLNVSSDELDNPIFVTERKGKYIVEDGNHRVLFSLITNKKSIKCLTLKLKL